MTRCGHLRRHLTANVRKVVARAAQPLGELLAFLGVAVSQRLAQLADRPRAHALPIIDGAA